MITGDRRNGCRSLELHLKLFSVNCCVLLWIGVIFMYVDCEFKLKDDSKGVPSHILAALFDVYHCLYYYGSGGYYITYGGRGSFHFGSNAKRLYLDTDLPFLMEMLGPWTWKAFLWLKKNTIYTGSSKNDEGVAMHPDDFFGYIENIIKHYEEGESNGYAIGSN